MLGHLYLRYTSSDGTVSVKIAVYNFLKVGVRPGMFVLVGILFLLVYGLLVFYIGWSGWSWMKPVVAYQISLVVYRSTSFSSGFLYFGAHIWQHFVSRCHRFLLAGGFLAIIAHITCCAPDVVASALDANS